MIVKGVSIYMLIYKRLMDKDNHSLQGKQYNKLTSYMYLMNIQYSRQYTVHAQDTLATCVHTMYMWCEILSVKSIA